MKASYLFLLCFVIIFSFILQSCGNENMVTQPPEKPVSEAPMAKISTTLAFTADTLITLKKSGKMLMLPEGLTAGQIDKLDKFLSENKTPAATTSLIQPNAEMCGWHTAYGWEYEYQYEPVNGKALGVWINYDYLNQQQLYNLGFRKIAIYNAEQRDEAYIAGFQYQNMMYMTDNYHKNIAYLGFKALNTNTIHINSCYIDEPFESSKLPQWSTSEIIDFSDSLQNNYPSVKLFLSSFNWPVSSYYDWPIPQSVYSLDNIFIMCDQYQTNTSDIWTAFKNFYGSKNISNFMDLEYNKPGVGSSNGDFSTLFGRANGLGINDIWLYANNYDNITLVDQFCDAAWSNGWLTKFRKRIIITWRCDDPNPC